MDESVKRYVLIAVAVVLLAAAAYGVWNSFGGDDVVKQANTVTFICAETERVFQIRLEAGMTGPPLENPKTGRRSLFPAEWCYWDQCGDRDGTPVLMKEYQAQFRGEDSSNVGPTNCPVCGHIVRFRNPKPPDYPKPD
jgi:hypothetical protein